MTLTYNVSLFLTDQIGIVLSLTPKILCHGDICVWENWLFRLYISNCQHLITCLGNYVGHSAFSWSHDAYWTLVPTSHRIYKLPSLCQWIFILHTRTKQRSIVHIPHKRIRQSLYFPNLRVESYSTRYIIPSNLSRATL